MPRARVLAVDDQRYFRELIEGVLIDEGYEVVTAASGEEALHVLARADFEIVVTDLVMPGMDGVELVRRVKERKPDQEIVMVTGVSDGMGSIIVTHGEHSSKIPVRVTGTRHPKPVDFQRDVIPILTRHGCNSGACHGKASGQNGFKLSLFGFDEKFDFDALSKEARGRRIFLPEPHRSLLLRKPTGHVPHGGGKRL